MIDSVPERVFTSEEMEIMVVNVAFYDTNQKIYPLRCAMEDCKYILLDARTAYEVPSIGMICEVCWELHQAIRYVNLKGDVNKYGR